MNNFILIGLCILAGFALRRLRILPDGSHRGINVWIIYLAVPAVALKYIPTITWSYELLLPALMPVIVWSGSWLTFRLYSLRWPLAPSTRAALTLTAGLGNTSFLGFPLVAGYYGDHALPIAVISDQVSFIIMSTLGAAIAMGAQPHPTLPKGEGLNSLLTLPSPKERVTANTKQPPHPMPANREKPTFVTIIKKVLLFPPFIASCAALILPHFIDLSPINPLFDKLAATLIPLALFSVGMQLSLEGWRDELPYLSIGLGYKLIIAPALILIVILAFHLHGLTPQISLFEAAMAPMITAGVIATQYDLDPRVANLMIGIGILLSFITTAIWWWVLRAFA